MENKAIKIKLKSYDPKLVDKSAVKIIEVAKLSGAEVYGPVPLPTRREVFTILRSVHVNKTSREQFELRTHKRLIGIKKATPETMDKLNRIQLPTGVSIEIKLLKGLGFQSYFLKQREDHTAIILGRRSFSDIWGIYL